MPRHLLLDGYNLVYRCFFATPPLTRRDGLPTNALHGWINSLWRLQDENRPDCAAVFFDLGGARDRLALLPEYKANRPEMPAELSLQVEPIKQLTRLLGLPVIEQEGVESDDLLAAAAVRAAAGGNDVLIVSSDKDFAQIVSDRIHILLPSAAKGPRQELDRAGVIERFGVPPECIAGYLAMMGDTSDNIPGLHGVGPKTAARWLNEHGSLEGVIAHADSLQPARFRTVVAEQAERLRLNLRITTLQTDLPVPEIASGRPDLNGLDAFLGDMQMATALAESRRRYAQPELF